MVGETPDERSAAKRPAPAKKSSGEALAKLGLAVSELTADQKKELNVATGVLVENAEGVAARAGIRRGDVIMAVNNQDVKTADELNRLLSPGTKPAPWRCWLSAATARLYIPLKLNGN